MSFQALRRDAAPVGVYGKPKEDEATEDLEVLNVRVLKPLKRYVEGVAESVDDSQRAVMERFIRQAQVLESELGPLSEELEGLGLESGLFPLEDKFPEIIALAVKQYLASRPKAKPKK